MAKCSKQCQCLRCHAAVLLSRQSRAAGIDGSTMFMSGKLFRAKTFYDEWEVVERRPFYDEWKVLMSRRLGPPSAGHLELKMGPSPPTLLICHPPGASTSTTLPNPATR